MDEPLTAMAVLEQLQSNGASKVEMSRDEIAHGWRIRANGGLVVHIHDNGKLRFSRRNSRAMRKALGLSGRREADCASPAENRGGRRVRLRKVKPDNAAPTIPSRT